MDYNDKCLTINGKDYIVVEQVDYDNHNYVYLSNSYDDRDTMFAEIKDGKALFIDPELFDKKILPLFVKNLAKKED